MTVFRFAIVSHDYYFQIRTLRPPFERLGAAFKLAASDILTVRLGH